MMDTLPHHIDLALYSDRYIALVYGRVVGTGLTAQQAYRAAKQVRGKDEPQIYFIDAAGNIKHLNIKD